MLEITSPRRYRPNFINFDRAILLLSIAFAFYGCTNDSPVNAGKVENRAPVIDSLVITNAHLNTGDVTHATIYARDPENDNLQCRWMTSPTIAGSALNGWSGFTLDWQASDFPSPGWTYFIARVSDAAHTVSDSVLVTVQALPQSAILSPEDGSAFCPGDTIRFIGKVSDFEDPENRLRIEWISDHDSLLNNDPPDADGNVAFLTTALSYNAHKISLVVTDTDSNQARSEITVNNLRPPPITLHSATGGGQEVNLKWSRTTIGDFLSYSILKSSLEAGEMEAIATVTEINDTSYLDTNIIIGSTSKYCISLITQRHFSSYSDTLIARVGHLLTFLSQIGAICFASDPNIAYAALTDLDSIAAIDLTQGTVVKSAWGEDAPQGLAYASSTNCLYIGHSHNTTLSALSLPNLQIVADYDVTIRCASVGYNPAADRLIVAELSDNWAPMPRLVRPSDGSVMAIFPGMIYDGGGILAVDQHQPYVYFGETGVSPAGVYEYTIASDLPQLLVEDEHGSLGDNLKDIALRADGRIIYVACGYPYHIQALSAFTLREQGELETGPYPCAIAVSPDGQRAFAAHGDNDVLVFNTSSNSAVRSYKFTDQVSERGLTVSPDGRYLLVETASSLAIVRIAGE